MLPRIQYAASSLICLVQRWARVSTAAANQLELSLCVRTSSSCAPAIRRAALAALKNACTCGYIVCNESSSTIYCILLRAGGDNAESLLLPCNNYSRSECVCDAEQEMSSRVGREIERFSSPRKRSTPVDGICSPQVTRRTARVARCEEFSLEALCFTWVLASS